MRKSTFDKLNEARRLDGEIKRKRLHIEELETILMPKAIRYDIEKVQHEPVDNLADIVMEIAAIREDIVKLQKKMIAAIGVVRGMIERIDNDNQKNVMTCRYIRCMSQEETAERLRYTRRHIQRLEAEGKAAIERRRKNKSCR